MPDEHAHLHEENTSVAGTPPRHDDGARPRPRPTTAVATLVAAIVILVALVPLTLTTIRVDSGDCGTFFASADEWTYTSSYEGADAYFDLGLSPESSVRAGVDALMSDLSLGSSVQDACQNAHDDRGVIVYTLAGAAAVLLVVSAVAFVRWRRAR